jgi:diguanylate cyclase (GGDEF)-like protein/PAS domain S-box-containing protein
MFSPLFDQMADNVLITDTSGNIEYVNPAFEATTGYASREVIGRSAALLKSGHHPAEIYDELWRALRSGSHFRFIFTNRRKDGTIYEEGVMISPIRAPSGEASHYILIGRVIEAFRQTYDAFTLLGNSSPAGIFVLWASELFYVNQELCSYLESKPEELIGRDWNDFVFEEDSVRVKVETADMLAGNRTTPIEFRLVSKGGAKRWMMQTLRSVAFRGVEFAASAFTAGYVMDITDRKLTEAQLEHTLSLHAATIESSTDGIVVVDRSGRIVSSNRRFGELWNLSGNSPFASQRGATLETMLSQIAEPERLRERLREIGNSDLDVSDSFDLLDGRTLEVYSRPQLVNGVKTGRVWSWRDVSERQRFETTLLRLASHDSLTGLYNRRELTHEMERVMESAQNESNALLLLDLDRLKEINDTLGHQAGDEVLIQVARILEEACPNHFVSRYGGDEFAVFMAGARIGEARTAAQHVLDELCFKTYLAGGVEVSLTGSIGIAAHPAHAKTVAEVVSHADLAMYSAKSSGGDRICIYSPSERELGHLQAGRELQVRLLEAVEERRWKLYSQRARALNGGDLAITRLLIRFMTRNGALLAMGRESALAEHPSVLRTLNRWLLQEAAGLLERGQPGDERTLISLNLPWQALADEQFIEQMQLAMGWERCEHGRVLVELNGAEGAIAGRGLRRTMDSLRPLGYRFMVTDVGSPSLYTLLKTLPVDFVRLNAAWVRDIKHDAIAREIVSSLVRIAGSLGVATLADNVSDLGALEALRCAGVGYARGSAIARPRPASLLLRTPVSNEKWESVSA